MNKCQARVEQEKKIYIHLYIQSKKKYIYICMWTVSKKPNVPMITWSCGNQIKEVGCRFYGLSSSTQFCSYSIIYLRFSKENVNFLWGFFLKFLPFISFEAFLLFFFETDKKAVFYVFFPLFPLHPLLFFWINF